MSLSLAKLSFLDLIRGFVAVGRRMSITDAAKDLCLTQSAVSRQVRALEAQLGVRLLVRGYRSIAFTAEGERLFLSADGAVQQLQDALGVLGHERALRPVVVSASIGVTGLWLLPRLDRFQRRHPGVDLRVSANNAVNDLRRDGVDLAIRYAQPQAMPEGAQRLFGESVTPVAHPSLGITTLRSKAALRGVTLLEFDDPQHPWLQWRAWLDANDWRDAKPRAVVHFNQYDQVVQAAVAGHGVALARVEILQPWLDDGRLLPVALPKSPPPSAHAYWLLRAEERPRDEVRRVAAWIEEEARSSPRPEAR